MAYSYTAHRKGHPYWRTLNIAREYSRFFHSAKIYKTPSGGYVVLMEHEKKPYKSWKLVEKVEN